MEMIDRETIYMLFLDTFKMYLRQKAGKPSSLLKESIEKLDTIGITEDNVEEMADKFTDIFMEDNTND